MKLKGRVAVVTGSSSGIGRRISIDFAKQGAKVVLASRNESSQLDYDRTTTEVIQENGDDAIYTETDVTNKKDIYEMVETAITEYGSLDILVNNAGVSSSNSVHKVAEKEWKRVHSVNLDSIYRCSKAAIPHLKNSSYGRIINISSQRGLLGGAAPEKAAYASSKGAVSNLTRQMALDYGPEGITVNAICPGPIKSNMTRVDSKEKKDRLLSGLLTSFVGKPRDVSATAVLLASDEGRYIHGENISIDGGSRIK